MPSALEGRAIQDLLMFPRRAARTAGAPAIGHHNQNLWFEALPPQKAKKKIMMMGLSAKLTLSKR